MASIANPHVVRRVFGRRWRAAAGDRRARMRRDLALLCRPWRMSAYRAARWQCRLIDFACACGWVASAVLFLDLIL